MVITVLVQTAAVFQMVQVIPVMASVDHVMMKLMKVLVTVMVMLMLVVVAAKLVHQAVIMSVDQV